MPRVGVSCTALFALVSLTDVELEGCHIILGVDSPSDGKASGRWPQGLWIILAENCAAIRLCHCPEEHRQCAPSTKCLTCRARIRCRPCPLTHDSPSLTTIFWLLYLTRTSAVSYPCPWRDPCQWSVAQPARSMPRVGVSCTALFAFSSLTDVELEGCHISWVWTRLLMGK